MCAGCTAAFTLRQLGWDREQVTKSAAKTAVETSWMEGNYRIHYKKSIIVWSPLKVEFTLKLRLYRSRNRKRPPATVLPIDLIDLWQQVLMTQQNRSTEIMSNTCFNRHSGNCIASFGINWLREWKTSGGRDHLCSNTNLKIRFDTQFVPGSDFSVVAFYFQCLSHTLFVMLRRLHLIFCVNSWEFWYKTFSFSAGFYPEQLTVHL